MIIADEPSADPSTRRNDLGLGRKAKARSLFRKILRRDPNHALAVDHLKDQASHLSSLPAGLPIAKALSRDWYWFRVIEIIDPCRTIDGREYLSQSK